MKTATLAFMLPCTTAALAQIPAEKPVNESYMYASTPRFIVNKIKALDYTYEPSYKNIKPPLPGEGVSKAYYKTDTHSASTIKHSSGTTIKIPAGAFVDDKGNTMDGAVTIAYREYKNPLDFILSGIPMSYDDTEGKNQFISAGMFEINASANGKEVFLKDGSKVEMDFASVDAAPDYNLYAFNDETGSWEMKTGKNSIPVMSKNPVAYSSAINRYMSAIKYPRNSVYDSTRFNERFENISYFYTEKIEDKNVTDHRWSYGGRLYRSLLKVVNTHKGKDGTITFQIARTMGTVTHAELSPYYHVSWKLVGNTDYHQFKKTVSSKNYFSDIRIEKDGDAYKIRMKGVKGFSELSAVPVKVNQDYKVKAYPRKTKDKMYKTYSKMLAWRGKYFNNLLVRGAIYNNFITVSPDEMPQYAWSNAKSYMTPEEKKMTFEQWQDYLAERQKAEKEQINYSAASSSTITRSFAIDGMGIWNCDQIKRLDNPVTVFASYEDKSGKPFKASNTFVINKKINGVLQYYNDEVSFSKTSDNVIITIKDNGDIAYMTPDELKKEKYKNKSPYTFTMNESSGGTTSVADLRKALGL